MEKNKYISIKESNLIAVFEYWYNLGNYAVVNKKVIGRLFRVSSCKFIHVNVIAVELKLQSIHFLYLENKIIGNHIK